MSQFSDSPPTKFIFILAIKRHCTQLNVLYNTSTEWSSHLTKKGKSDCFFPNFVTLWTFVLMLSSVRGDCQSINDTFSLGPFLFRATRYNKPANAHTLAGTSWRINSRQECVYRDSKDSDLKNINIFDLLDGLFVSVRNSKSLGSHKLKVRIKELVLLLRPNLLACQHWNAVTDACTRNIIGVE